MIDILAGRVVAEGEHHLVVMAGEHVGLRVHVTRNARQNVDDSNFVTLYTYLLVREDNLTLYGFADADERELYLTLIGVNGVGPRLALMVLSTLSREQLRDGVINERPEVLTRVPGIGKKTAQKIVFELKGKLGDGLLEGIGAVSDVDTDVIATLTALGYSIIEAQSAVQSIPLDAPQEVEERVRLALNYFA